MRRALWGLGIVDWLAALGALAQLRMLKNTDAQTSPDTGAVLVFGVAMVAVILFGLASGAVLIAFASLREPKKWGTALVVAGLVAPALLLAFAFR